MFEDFLVFAHIVYEAAPTVAADSALTYKAFSKLSNIEKIEFMMSEVVRFLYFEVPYLRTQHCFITYF